MRWDGCEVIAVEGRIPSGEWREPFGPIDPVVGWAHVAYYDRIILRLAGETGECVRAVAVSEIRKYAAEIQKLLRLAEIALVCPGEGCCHGRLDWCERCGDVFDVCDVGTACAYHGEEAKERRIAAQLAWLNSLSVPETKDAD